MENKNLTIHFAPGARGDFLASVLTDSWESRGDNGALRQPAQYNKIHFLSATEIPPNSVTIRIDDNNNIDNIMQIAYGHFTKNPVDFKTTFVDQFYLFVVDMLLRNSSDNIHQIHYDYWIDFSALSDIEFIKMFYFEIRAKPIDEVFASIIDANIKQQKCWKENPELLKLGELINFENKFKLFKHYKNFSIENFSHDDLILSNYSRTPHVPE